jgi:MGT family glycosyltransferase
MRITILTVGSRGDVQPYVALGLGLKAAGHTVKVATAHNFAGFVTGHGLEFAPLAGDMVQLMQSEAGLQAMERGNIIGFMHKAIDAIEPIVDRMAQDALEACRDADAIVAATSMVFPAEALAEYLGIPYVPSYPQPILPTRDYQSMAFPPAPSWLGLFKGAYNRLSHQIMLQFLWQLMRSPSNRVRRRMGLPTMPLFASLKDIWKGQVPVLYCFSPNVVPPASDHGENVKVCGYWFVDRPADWQPSADLVAFLETGPAPVYIGFGSMTDRNPEELTRIALDALAAAGQRGVLLSGWGGIGKEKLPENVFVIDSAPHDWLFPKMAAIVHHGGAGTTAASLRAGVPTIVVPFIADQPFWGDRVHKLGVGLAPIPRKQLTVSALGEAIRTAVTDKEMRSRAAALGDCIRSENGVQVAVDMIERYLKTA